MAKTSEGIRTIKKKIQFVAIHGKFNKTGKQNGQKTRETEFDKNLPKLSHSIECIVKIK